ncbi:uncharacterized protein [Nicotiana sylvestris]|uniref:uncharacterized protein n=1 Tax=Nicotiana sylvestris TaxID=4096 RepID=UPI00388C3F89
MGEVNETNPSGKYLNLEEMNNTKQKRFLLKSRVSTEEEEEFFRKMKTADYKKVLIKTLNEAYVPIETTFEQLERMAEQFFEVNQISFSRNDLPPEGAAHNKALHLTVKYEGYYVKRVMVDGGSGVDICPLSTLQRMDIGTERIRPNNVCVHAFDGIKRDTIGEIDLILTISLVDFEVTFQVLDMDTSYNFLLGRPWIHAAGVVPSTLHQMVKFEHEDQEIVVHGEDEQSIYRDSLVPCLEAREGSEHIVYQAFEVVFADQCEEGSPCPQPFLSNVSIMFSTKMIKHEYKPGKGLEVSLQGITEPITLAAPVPHLSKTFVKLKYAEEEEDEAFTADEIEDICEAMRKMLYEAHIVQLGEGSSTIEIQSFVDCYAGYHQVLMDEEDAEKTAFTTPWGTYCYRFMPFGLNNAGATYIKAMTSIFHDKMHQEIEVYVDDVIIKSRMQDDHVRDLRKFFEHLRKYSLKLNPAKCAFGVPYGKLLGFIVSRRGIELDPTKIKSIQDLPPLRTKKEVMSMLGRLNYISRFIA